MLTLYIIKAMGEFYKDVFEKRANDLRNLFKNNKELKFLAVKMFF